MAIKLATGMPQPMSTAEIENELAMLLSDLTSIQEEMLDVLSQKRDFMAAGDLLAMTGVQQREEGLCQRLQHCHQRRADLLQLATRRGMPAETMSQVSNQLPAESRSKLREQVKETSARMRLLQHQSLTNWVLAQRSLLHIAQLLEMIATGGEIQPTDGKDRSVHLRGKLVNQKSKVS